MNRFIAFITFASLTGFMAANGLAAKAGGCSSNMYKDAEIKCAEDDPECQTEKAEKFEFNKTVRS